MDITVAGARGQVARHLVRLLVDRGDRVRGLIRNPSHRAEVAADGAEPLVCDLEHATDADVDAAVTGSDAIVFAAGAGPGSGAERKWTVDYGGARRLMDAAGRTGVRRYVMVSAMGADHPPQDEDVFSVYLRAKARADEELRSTGLDHTIVRPGRLTDDAGTGRVRIGVQLGSHEVPRADVAAVLAAVLAEPGTIGRTFEVVAGDSPVDDAVRSATGPASTGT